MLCKHQRQEFCGQKITCINLSFVCLFHFLGELNISHMALIKHLLFLLSYGIQSTKQRSVSGVVRSDSSCRDVLRRSQYGVVIMESFFFFLKFSTRYFWGQIRTVCRSIKYQNPLFFFISRDIAICAEFGLVWSCWKMHGRLWKRFVGSIVGCCSLNLSVFFCICAAITEM